MFTFARNSHRTTTTNLKRLIDMKMLHEKKVFYTVINWFLLGAGAYIAGIVLYYVMVVMVSPL